MELRHLRYFVTVAHERGFTRAAEKLGMAQPPLSRQIQQLEEELGFPLLDRGTRPTELTEAGRLIYEQALQILERVDELQAMLDRMHRAKRDRLGIGFVASTLYGRLPEVIRQYRAARPGVELILLELTTFEQISALKEGRIDVGFGRIPLDDPALKRTLLRNERLVVALPVDHTLLERAGPVRLQELEGEALVIYPRAPRPSYADQVLALYRDRNLKPGTVHEVRELQTALGLVAAGVGIALVPASVRGLQRDGVSYRALDEEKATSPIIMSCRKDDKSPEIGLILRLIRGIYRKDGITFGE